MLLTILPAGDGSGERGVSTYIGIGILDIQQKGRITFPEYR
jgi:hypothetical protein